MDKAELSEIRARLRADAEMEGRRPRRPLLGPLRALLGPSAPPSPPKPAYPTPRRVGLNPTSILRDEAGPVRAEPLETTGRYAFGRRSEPALEPLPLLRLAAPEPQAPERAVEAIVAPRWGSMPAKVHPAAAMAETPYHPEDVCDPTDGEAERLYAAAGLARSDPDRPSRWPKGMREAASLAPAPVALTPEQELLMHLERVMLVEFATVEARRLPD
jgi:hypothetical protein